jgi:hypothetical protein
MYQLIGHSNRFYFILFITLYNFIAPFTANFKRTTIY